MSVNTVRMVPIKLRPPDEIVKVIRPSVEETGNGTLLCFDGFSGRYFRSSEKHVRNAIKEFCDMYASGDYISWNELYRLLGIAVTHFGAKYGYPGNNDYRNCGELKFNITLVPACEHFEKMGEDVLVFEPLDEYYYPCDFYMEV